MLAAGNRLPEYPAYIIRQNPTRVAGQDGFTTFTSSSFAGTLSTSAGIPAVFGASVGDFTINYTQFTIFQSNTISVSTIIRLKILSDTITRTFTMLPNVSVTTLATPLETGSTLYSVIGKTQIINVNRQSFGGVDEVQVTWGLAPGEYAASRTIFP